MPTPTCAVPIPSDHDRKVKGALLPDPDQPASQHQPAPMPAALPTPALVVPHFILVHIATSGHRASELLLEVARALAIHFNETAPPADLLVPLANLNSEIAYTAEMVRAVIEENKTTKEPS
jgi:hypothetical protein